MLKPRVSDVLTLMRNDYISGNEIQENQNQVLWLLQKWDWAPKTSYLPILRS